MVLKHISAFFLNLFIIGIFSYMVYYFVPDKYINFLGIEIRTITNFTFLILFILFGVIPKYFTNHQTIGDFVFKTNRKIKNKNFLNTFHEMLIIFFDNLLYFIKDLTLFSFIIWVYHKLKNRKNIKNKK